MNNTKLDVLSSGLAAGAFWAVGLGGMTIISGLTNSPEAGEYTGYAGTLIKGIMSIYPGYNISVSGLFIGAAWALVDGFISGVVLALLYNFFSNGLGKRRKGKFPSRETDRDIHVSM